MDSELLGEVIEGVETVTGVKALLVLPVASLDLAVMTGCVRTNELMPDTQLGSSGFKQGGQITLAVGKTVGKLKAIVCLDALHADTLASIPLEQLFQEIGGGIGGLLRVGSQEAQAGELIDGGVLVQAQLRVGDAAAGDHLHIHLDPLTWIGHLLVGLGFISWFLLFRREQAQLSHDPEQALRAAGVAALPQTVPQLHHAEAGVPAAHVPDQLQLRFRVLIGMAVGPPGLAS